MHGMVAVTLIIFLFNWLWMCETEADARPAATVTKKNLRYGVFVWQMPSFGCERTVAAAAAAAKALGEGRGGLVPEFVCAHAQCERKHESWGCISFPLSDALCSNSEFLASCHSVCLYSWIQSECFRDFLSKQRWDCDAGYLSVLIKVCPICLFCSKLLLSNQTYRWHKRMCFFFFLSYPFLFSNVCFTCMGSYIQRSRFKMTLFFFWSADIIEVLCVQWMTFLLQAIVCNIRVLLMRLLAFDSRWLLLCFCTPLCHQWSQLSDFC